MTDEVSIKLLRFFHGPFRGAIIKSLNIEDTEENREEVKRIIKDSMNIESLADLTPTELGTVINEVAMIFDVELGGLLPYPGDPDNIEELSMREFLALTKKH